MKKAFNYVSYCIYSFIPLYLVLFVYAMVKQDVEGLLFITVLTLYSLYSLLSACYAKPNNIFVCSKKEVAKQSGIDYGYLVLTIIMTFLIINEKLQVSSKILFLLIIFIILFKIFFKYKNYTLVLLGYKMYNIRDKIVYSKKNEQELYKILKEKKSLQVFEISDNILIESDKYRMTNFYCEDF